MGNVYYLKDKIMYKIIIVGIFILILAGCSEKNEQELNEDNNILSLEKFTLLMTDVQLLEGHLNTNRVNQVFVMDSSKNYYKEILSRHNITLEDYKKNLTFYTARPNLLEKVYTKIEEKLVIQERLYKEILIDQPAISPINRSKLLKVIISDTTLANLVLDTTFTYIEIKDSLFNVFTDTLLKVHSTNVLSFQQSFNVSTHTTPLFRVFRKELKNKLDKIKGID